MQPLIDRLKNTTLTGFAMMGAVLVIAGLVAFVLVARAVNTAPAQCASCHPEMTALFKAGTTHPEARATCHQCHSPHAELPEGFNIIGYVRDVFIPEKYMSSAERVEGRCAECHTDVATAETEKAKLIKVNHKIHLAKKLEMAGSEIRLGCLDCHASVAHDRSVNPTNRPAMQGCFAGGCHAKDRNADSCLRCHYQSLKVEQALAEVKAASPEAAEVKK